jgi:hypothetical protein
MRFIPWFAPPIGSRRIEGAMSMTMQNGIFPNITLINALGVEFGVNY